ncbi:hypothetical protein [Nannocystis punicea]|uniref:MalT-like TPR region domain-containing protein n=1 Tax=Nannocystis punicea TaxID=2995304 RepID=A0ABY7GSD4_9BACT|nr:hypothetical protein [Nannocystis poenicansa]WAS89853.1 hypothetical protein O0S08_26980 [Nannocystis poenicansa]
MTELAPDLPPWVHPYESDFRELLRQLDLVPGFIFQPVVLPSPDLARALADWLAGQGVEVRVIDMRHDPWDELGTRLRTLSFDSSSERRAVVVITPSHLDRAAARDGLAAFNFSRDSIASNLQCPLLWCGDVHLLRTTAELATDFWSIAATVYRIPLRALSDVPRGPMRLFWSGATRESAETIASRLEHSRLRGDVRAIAQASLDLAEAQLAAGQRSEASRTLEAARAVVKVDVPALELRQWCLERTLRAPGLAEGIDDLRAQLADAHARGAVTFEALLHQKLAELYSNANRQSESLEARLAARALYLDTGDDAAAMAVESNLEQFLDQLSPDLTKEIRAHAEHMISKANTPGVRINAWSFLAALAYHQQRWDEAEEAATAILRETPPSNPFRLHGLVTRQQVAFARDDWTRAVAHSSELRDFALAHDAPPLVFLGMQGMGLAQMMLGEYRCAGKNLLSTLELAAKLGIHDAEASLTFLLALAAEHLGAREICTAFLARSLESTLRAGLPVPLRTAERTRQTADRELIDILDSLAGEPGNRKLALMRLHALSDAKERALRGQGVDISNIDTWQVSEPSQSGSES